MATVGSSRPVRLRHYLITPLQVFRGLALDSINFSWCTDMRLELPVSGAGNPNGRSRC